jgi:hypothetical protein
MPLFRRPSEDTLNMVQAKLAAAREALAALEAELQERSYEAVLADGEIAETVAPHQAKVAKARATVSALELADAEARRQHEKQLRIAADDVERSRRRSCGQHAGAARRAAVKVREGLEQALVAYADLVAAAQRAERLFKPNERLQLLAFGGLQGALAAAVRAEMARLNGHNGDEIPIQKFPLTPAPNAFGSYTLLQRGQHISELDPIEARVGQMLDLAGLLNSGFVPPRAPGQIEAKAPRADEPPRPEFPEVEDPPEVIEAQRTFASPHEHTPEEVSAAYQTLSRYGS